MKVFTKICGLTKLEDATFAIASGVDAIGFIAYPKSPRYISSNAVTKICADLCTSDVLKVGVFVNTTIEVIESYISAGIDTIQLHGDESENFAIQCKNLKGIKEVWKAIKPASIDEVLAYADYPADKIVLDASHKTLHGGTGLVVDQNIAKFAISQLPSPIILAGGLNPDNIENIINDIAPYGVDINSGAEISPGVKDHKLIEKMFEAIN